MPSAQILVSFREGLKILQQADDFTTLRQTIDTLAGICPPEELPLAKDAIARVIRLKQANEAIKFQAYPQALEEVDKKYRDLYIVLRTSKSKVAPQATMPSAMNPNNMTGPPPAPPKQNQIAKLPSLSGLSLPSLMRWLGDKKKYILTGGALATSVGGAYWLYKHLNDEPNSKKDNPAKESSLDKTIRSIQKYKAFTQMVNDPNFSGDYAELMSGKTTKKKKNTRKKKEDPQKSREWDRDEKSLMGDMDTAFNSLSSRPQLAYKLPQLPAPKNIDPRDVVDDSELLSLKPRKAPAKKKIKRTRKRKPKKEAQEEAITTSIFPTAVSSPEKPKRTRKSRKEKSSFPKEPKTKKVKKIDAPPGRLIPIVKRTKRVKKVNS